MMKVMIPNMITIILIGLPILSLCSHINLSFIPRHGGSIKSLDNKLKSSIKGSEDICSEDNER